jgi:hypothetical protein
MSSNRILYGPAIGDAIASGELERMRAMLKEAEQHLDEHGNVGAAAEALKVEISKAERSSEAG